MRPPIKWHGGKYYLAKKIISLMPSHKIYVEPFGGAASVLLNKPVSPVEIYNDLDERLTNLFQILRDSPNDLISLLKLTPYSEVEFNRATEKTENKLEQARRDFVLFRQSMGGRGQTFSYSKKRVRRNMSDVVSGWWSSIDELIYVAERFKRVQIMKRDFEWVFRKWDSPDTLFYCDPPYVSSVRTSKNVYSYEMSNDDHERLLEIIEDCSGHILLSGYNSDMYNKLKLEKHVVDIANHAAGGKKKKIMQENVWVK